MQKTSRKKKNDKKDCSTCPAKGACLAEKDMEEYSCPRDDWEKNLGKGKNFRGTLP